MWRLPLSVEPIESAIKRTQRKKLSSKHTEQLWRALSTSVNLSKADLRQLEQNLESLKNVVAVLRARHLLNLAGMMPNDPRIVEIHQRQATYAELIAEIEEFIYA